VASNKTGTTRVPAGEVAWVAPEVLDRARGEYRRLHERRDEGNLIVDVFGDRVVWVDDTPDDPTDGAGHFEVYEGPDEGYTAIKTLYKDAGQVTYGERQTLIEEENADG
jgi:hypothetical protein